MQYNKFGILKLNNTDDVLDFVSQNKVLSFSKKKYIYVMDVIKNFRMSKYKTIYDHIVQITYVPEHLYSAYNSVANVCDSRKKLLPCLNFYNYRIEGYSYNGSHSFTTGFKFVTKNNCGEIIVDNKKNHPNNDLSGCDVLEMNDLFKDANDIVENGNDVSNFVRELYEEYKKTKTRTVMPDINSNLWSSFCNKWYSKLVEHMDIIIGKHIETFKNNNVNIDMLLENSYIQQKYVDNSDKIIIFGDIHGSFHTFFRILYRLHYLDILNIRTMKLKEGYYIIFLGDVIDRGVFSLEILMIIFWLLIINEKQVIYNRGNHETEFVNVNYGLKYEIDKRCSAKMRNIFTKINKYYSYLPSAIILNNGYKFWLSHGGIDPSFLEKNNLLDTNKLIIVLPNVDMQDNLRWSDFKYYNKNDPEINSIRGIGFIYNEQHVRKFLLNNGFNFIIRGHQDNIDQFNLLRKPTTADKKDTFSIEKNTMHQNIIGIDNKPVYYNNTSKKFLNNRRKGPIARIILDNNLYTDSYIGKVYDNNNNYNTEVYPVLTLSTNTDNGRFLRNDSFAILNFTPLSKISHFTNHEN